jgi:hypothetical protein
MCHSQVKYYEPAVGERFGLAVNVGSTAGALPTSGLPSGPVPIAYAGAPPPVYATSVPGLQVSRVMLQRARGERGTEREPGAVMW